MALLARFHRTVFHALLLGGAMLLCGCPSPTASAGFELILDTSSVRQVDKHYSVDVVFKSSTDVNVWAIFTTLTTKTDGLQFLGIEPPANGSFNLFLPEADPASSGTIDELWHANIFSPGIPQATQGGVAFRLNFSVPNAGEYDIDFVNSLSNTEDRTRLLFGPVEKITSSQFDVLSSPPVLVGTPEPSSLVLLATAMSGLGVWKWRRRHAVDET